MKKASQFECDFEPAVRQLQTSLENWPCSSAYELAAKFFMEKELQKKMPFARSSDAREAALNSFKEQLDEQRTISLDSEEVRLARDFIRRAFEAYYTHLAIEQEAMDPVPGTVIDDTIVYHRWRFGPGASYGVEGTHAVDKLSTHMSCTPAALNHVLMLRRSHPYLRAFDKLKGVDNVKVVPGSRLTTVPKNSDIDRVIAIEPSGNMALQLGLGRYIEEVLAFQGLDIRYQQTRNRALAKLGSEDGSLATLDLSKASDSISIELIKLLWPKELVTLFLLFRSPQTEICLNGVKGQHKLTLMSTMGNGFTFPMMTMTFLALIYAMKSIKAGSHNGYVDFTRYAVFGDDIEVPADQAGSMISILRRAGFKTNVEKSFVCGKFRESCGGYYHGGRDMTPFRSKGVRSLSDLYVTVNGLIDWAVKTGFGSRIVPTISLLLRQVTHPYFVPEWEMPDSGIRTAEHVPKRYKVLRQRRRSTSHRGFMEIPLICGGYLRPGKVYTRKGRGGEEELLTELLYTRRTAAIETFTLKLRLPSGSSSGWDPSMGSHLASSERDLIIALSLS
jgi:hypothetical protein